MREVEIKASIEEPTILIQNLLQHGAKFISKIVQKDRIYIHKNKNFLELGNGDKIFRIRSYESQIEFNLKIPMSNELDCLEYELRICNDLEMDKILFHLEFVEAICVSKTREIYILGELTFNLDDVDNLGKFVEVEKIVDRNDSSDYQIELKEMLSNFYNLPIEFHNIGYDTLLYKKMLIGK